MRNFGAADKMTTMMEKFGLKEGEELSHPWLNKSVQSAQKRVEQRNYTMRKRVLDFDDVMNEQRRIIYGLRNEIILTANPRELVNKKIDTTIPLKVRDFIPATFTIAPSGAKFPLSPTKPPLGLNGLEVL